MAAWAELEAHGVGPCRPRLPRRVPRHLFYLSVSFIVFGLVVYVFIVTWYVLLFVCFAQTPFRMDVCPYLDGCIYRLHHLTLALTCLLVMLMFLT